MTRTVSYYLRSSPPTEGDPQLAEVVAGHPIAVCILQTRVDCTARCELIRLDPNRCESPQIDIY